MFSLVYILRLVSKKTALEWKGNEIRRGKSSTSELGLILNSEIPSKINLTFLFCSWFSKQPEQSQEDNHQCSKDGDARTG